MKVIFQRVDAPNQNALVSICFKKKLNLFGLFVCLEFLPVPGTVSSYNQSEWMIPN
jgi:hypothetical protein